MKQRYLVFCGGGTGGHVYPALAIIEQLNLANTKVVWFGSRRGIERQLVRAYAQRQGLNLSYRAIPCGKLRRYFSWENSLDIFKTISGIFFCLVLFIRQRPKLVFSKGGYVAVPPCIAAGLLGIRVWTHESDSDPGLATKIIGTVAQKIFIAYEETRKFFPKSWQAKLYLSGNPVRAEFYKLAKDSAAEASRLKLGTRYRVSQDKPILLVLGGSLGALELNKLVWNLLPQLTEDFFVLHQTGRIANRQFVEDEFNCNKYENYFALEFIDEFMAELLRASSLVLCRAGAGTLWELLVTKTPAVLLPYTLGARGDQVRNAELFAARAWATHFESGKLRQTSVETALLAAIKQGYATRTRIRENLRASELGSLRADKFIAKNIAAYLH